MRNPVNAEMLENAVLSKLNEQISNIGEIKYSRHANNKNVDMELKKYQISLEKNNNIRKSLYKDYKEGILTKEEYLEYKKDYAKEVNLISGQIAFMEEAANVKNDENHEWVDMLVKYKNIKALDRETIAEALDKIVVTGRESDINIDIKFKFCLT